MCVSQVSGLSIPIYPFNHYPEIFHIHYPEPGKSPIRLSLVNKCEENGDISALFARLERAVLGYYWNIRELLEKLPVKL